MAPRVLPLGCRFVPPVLRHNKSGMRTSLLITLPLALLPGATFAQLPTYEPNFGKSGIDLGAMDPSIAPCANFYQYACGQWRARNPIPADRARWGRFDELAQNNLVVEREILEKSAVPTPNRSILDQKVGDLYASCMDEAAIDRKGVTPIRPELDEIGALRSKDQLASVLAKLGKLGIGAVFRFSAQPDYKDASVNVADIDQGGISLPDRDYYVKSDAASVDIRAKYEQHLTNMFNLLARAMNTTWDSKAKAAAVLKFETALAQASMDRAARRDPDNLNHPMMVKDLARLPVEYALQRRSRAALPENQREQSGVLQTAHRHSESNQSRRPQNLSHLARSARYFDRFAQSIR